MSGSDKHRLFDNVDSAEDRLWYAKALDRLESVQKRHNTDFTDFTNPFRANRFISIAKKHFPADIEAFGGYPQAERLMLGFAPEGYGLNETDFPIAAIKIGYAEKFSKSLEHRDFLGSIIGLGLDRSKTGDILLIDSAAVVVCSSDIADYIKANLEFVGHTKVKIETADLSSLDYEQNTKHKKIIVASLRLDAVISAAFGLSRSKAAALIKSEKAFINWICEKSAAKTLKENDIVTLRGCGRLKISEIINETKKGRLVINVRIY